MEKSFADLSEEWFREYGVADPVRAYELWSKWISKYPNQSDAAKHKKALQLGSGLAPTSIRFYLKNDVKHLSRSAVKDLDAMSKALGFEPPERYGGDKVRPRHGAKRIALLMELAGLPSPPYHLEVTCGLIRAASRYLYGTVLYEAPHDRLDQAIREVLRVFRPDAVVMLRLTPDRASLETLKEYGVPAVLVHSDRFKYPSPPILANIVPGQETIEPELWKWAKDLLGSPGSRRSPGRKGSGRPVVVAMPYERAARHLPRIDDVPPSIRNERIDLILDTLAAFRPIRFEVEDYSFRHAARVFKAHPDAPAYICLCDQIAVGIKLLAAAAGKDYAGRIIGFDGSDLARQEGIASFGQHLDEIGKLVTEKLETWFWREEGKEPKAEWPGFEQVRTDVRLVWAARSRRRTAARR
jgi:DNA-binding LacI/PurR family transcriptional regulator